MNSSNTALNQATSTPTSNPWARQAPVTAAVQILPEGISVDILDTRPECITGFTALEPGAQQQIVHDAWVVGTRAILNARAEAQEAQLSNIAHTFQNDLAEQLEHQTKHATELVQGVLAEYFDPESGCVGERLKHFIGDDGVLAHQLHRHLSPENSTLAATLAKNVGEQSLLFKKLSPTESEGIVQTLAQQLRRVLQEEHSEFQKALDPLHAEGAVAKFLAQMKAVAETVESDEATQLKVVLKQLDANDEQSLLSQLRRDMNAAQAQLLRAINPAQEDSPLATIQRTLAELLEKHVKSQQEREEAARVRQEAFHADVRERLERIETRKRVEQGTALAGRPFERAVVAFIQRFLGPSGYLVEPTGDTQGAKRRKVGDATIDFPIDHAFHGCRIVVEAKHDDDYTAKAARGELEQAKIVRDAQVGLFVLARSHASETFPVFQRCGHDVLVVWDETDPNNAPYLEGALMVALALATRKQAKASEGDLKALANVEERVTKEIARLEKMKKCTENIRKNADALAKELADGQEALRDIVADAKATLTALNVELEDLQEKLESPIEVQTG